jgi:hypothetical protein
LRKGAECDKVSPRAPKGFVQRVAHGEATRVMVGGGSEDGVE